MQWKLRWFPVAALMMTMSVNLFSQSSPPDPKPKKKRRPARQKTLLRRRS